ncbi:MAG: DUF4345 family protein [Pseudomonadota bacterium]
MIDIINIIAAVLTIGFGAFGFVAPRYTLNVLDLAPTQSNMGLSEARASVGGLFVALGLVAILVQADWLYCAIGIAYLGAAAGRVVSLILDAPPRNKLLVYFGIEAGLGLWLVCANLSAF